MGITVQHDIPAGLVVQAGTLGGAGQLAAEYRKRMETFQLQANSINAQKSAQAASLKAQSDSQAKQIAAQKDQMTLGHTLSLDTKADDFAKQKLLNEQMHKYGLEDMVAKEELWEANYTWKQQQQLENIQNVENDVMTNPSYGEPGVMTPQRQQAIWDLHRARANMNPSMRPKPVPIKIGDELENRWKEQPDGSTLIMQPDGTIDYRPPAQDKTAEVARKQAESEAKAKLETLKVEAKIKADNAKVAGEILKNAIDDPDLVGSPMHKWAMDFMTKNYQVTPTPPTADQSLWGRIQSGLLELGKRQLGMGGPAMQEAPGANQMAPGAYTPAPMLRGEGVPMPTLPGAMHSEGIPMPTLPSAMHGEGVPMPTLPGAEPLASTFHGSPNADEYPVIKSKKDYDSLPSGFLYRKEDGKLYRKK